jgi:hypothetical protein
MGEARSMLRAQQAALQEFMAVVPNIVVVLRTANDQAGHVHMALKMGALDPATDRIYDCAQAVGALYDRTHNDEMLHSAFRYVCTVHSVPSPTGGVPSYPPFGRDLTCEFQPNEQTNSRRLRRARQLVRRM